MRNILAMERESRQSSAAYNKMRGCLMSGFKDFIMRGNVLDLAVGVIIGGAFGKIVSSLTDDLIMPIVGLFTGGIDFSNKFIALGDVPAGTAATLAAHKAAGVATLNWGSFITAIINFLIIAFVIFQIVKVANRYFAMSSATAGPSEVDLLTEIRDALKK
jgi:large conductance mechanosensitive channel